MSTVMSVQRRAARPVTGLVSVAVVIGVILLAAQLIRDGFARTAPVTVLSPRAGLVTTPTPRCNSTECRSARSSPVGIAHHET